jgi:hypothetical protein
MGSEETVAHPLLLRPAVGWSTCLSHMLRQAARLHCGFENKLTFALCLIMMFEVSVVGNHRTEGIRADEGAQTRAEPKAFHVSFEQAGKLACRFEH